ncbi:hypothetical protein TSUD_365760 [Trifolium subterraneum]|uniref:Uncharacterized protein n=1 Tax=Trifolium subterraneum TaxID=3900 RepID=A0A2Z6NIY0_TRISU|nr:hypothetical protein TSUD_365760 [Trifolium subterraneum]
MGSVGIEVDGEGSASGRSNLDEKVDIDVATRYMEINSVTMKKFFGGEGCTLGVN